MKEKTYLEKYLPLVRSAKRSRSPEGFRDRGMTPLQRLREWQYAAARASMLHAPFYTSGITLYANRLSEATNWNSYYGQSGPSITVNGNNTTGDNA